MPGTTGEVEHVHSDALTPIFQWRIRDVSRLKRGPNYSPTVKCFNMEWNLMISKVGDGIDRVYLVRELLTPGIHFTITCGTSDGEERDVAREQTYPENKYMWCRRIDPPLRIPPSAGVTLTCSLRNGDSPHSPGVSRVTRTDGAKCSSGTRDDHVNPGVRGVSRETQTEDAQDRNDEHPPAGVSRETQTEDAHGRSDEHPLDAISSLLEHFKKLLLFGTGHDVLIKVGVKQFRAHKCVLEARSPVFAAMFSNEMAESTDGSVTIEDCDPDAFGEFLQFVYSGKADIASVSRALGLYYAGDKYDFPSLKKMCVQFLKNSFSTTTVFDVISLAARHDEEELLQQAIVYFAENLEATMITLEWQRFLSANPIQANEMSLKAVQCLTTSLHKK